MTLHQIFVQFLVDPEKVESLFPLFTSNEWDQVLQIARRTNLLSLLFYRIGQAEAELPENLQQTLRDRTRLSTVESLQKRAELTTVLASLNNAGIPPILFKGAVLAHTVYPSYTHRSMGDIDLWVPREQMALAQTILESLGYLYKEKAHRSHAMQALGDGELQMRGQTALQGLVELHYGVFSGEWMRIATHIDRTAVYDRLVPVTVCDQPVLRLATEDAAIQIALHVGINHQMTINSLRSLLDLEFLVRQGIDWSTLAQRCQEWRVYTAVSFVIDLWHQLFASEQSARAAAALPFRRKKLLGFFVGPEDLVQGHSLAESRWRLLYQLALIDHPGDALKLMVHTLWPDSAWLLARYADAQVRTRMQHFRQIFSGKV